MRTLLTASTRRRAIFALVGMPLAGLGAWIMASRGDAMHPLGYVQGLPPLIVGAVLTLVTFLPAGVSRRAALVQAFAVLALASLILGSLATGSAWAVWASRGLSDSDDAGFGVGVLWGFTVVMVALFGTVALVVSARWSWIIPYLILCAAVLFTLLLTLASGSVGAIVFVVALAALNFAVAVLAWRAASRRRLSGPI